MTPPLGIIDARFGTPWSWDDRTMVMQTLAPVGYRFFHYGPKADANLRRHWTERHPLAEEAAIASFAEACHRAEVRFGIALTPVGTMQRFDAAARAALARRIHELDALGIDDLCLSFDDLRGDVPDLAERQAEIVQFCAGITRAGQIWFCPTYYSDDPVLDQVFGARPAAYLEQLGASLDPAIRVYWTGEEVCAGEVGVAHLTAVNARLGRHVCLWDNYPVNDGPRMSRFLHLRGVTGRPAAIAPHLAAHAINPAVQPWLTCIPALTLAMAYDQGERYAYRAATLDAASRILGASLAAMLIEDLTWLQDSGLERLGNRGDALRRRYVAVDHPAAREVVRWLNGADLMTADDIRTQ